MTRASARTRNRRVSIAKAFLRLVCALQYVRRVANNNTVRIGGRIIDIPRKPRGRTYAKAYVVVRHVMHERRRRSDVQHVERFP